MVLSIGQTVQRRGAACSRAILSPMPMPIAEPMPPSPQARFLSGGDTALVVEFGDRVDRT